MGLLDDAIREHLELKRRHGADPTELDRLEHEALGPVRRQPLEPGSHKAGGPAQLDDRPVASERPSEASDAEDGDYLKEEDHDEAETADWEEPFDEDPARPRSQAPSGKASSGRSDRASTEPPAPRDGETERGLRRWRRSRRGSVPPEDAPPTQADPPTQLPRRGETGKSGVEDASAARGGNREEGPADDQPTAEKEADVLDETPNFLQDEPEHDRLWFEQRPPRDFDFDD